MLKVGDGVDGFHVAPPRLRIRLGVVTIALTSAILSFAWIERSAVLGAIARSWIVSDRTEPADAAAVLGGGTDTRPGAAAQLYASGLIKQILVFNTATAQGDAATVDNVDRRALLRFGVPARAVTELDENPANTYEEAQALLRWVQQNPVQRIIVPTEIFSSRRVRWILRRELSKGGVRVMVETVTASEYNAGDWWQHRAGLVDFRNEAIKYMYYRARY